MEVTNYLPLVLALIPLESVNPPRGSGFAASILGALGAVALLAIVAKFATTKPKHRRRPPDHRA